MTGGKTCARIRTCLPKPSEQFAEACLELTKVPIELQGLDQLHIRPLPHTEPARDRITYQSRFRLPPKSHRLPDNRSSQWYHPSPSPPHHSHHPLTPPQSLSTTAYILATLTAGGGITGYIRTGSVPSIAAGCTVGALYALGGFRVQQRQPYGVELALLASVVLAGSSIPRAIKTQKPLPIGLSLLATFGLVTFGSAWANGKGSVKVQ